MVLLTILSILMVSALMYLVIKLYDNREDDADTPMDVFRGLLSDTTIKTVTSALEKPSYGNIGEFDGYDNWKLSKHSGLGGGVHLYEPMDIRMMRSRKYVSKFKRTL